MHGALSRVCGQGDRGALGAESVRALLRIEAAAALAPRPVPGGADHRRERAVPAEVRSAVPAHGCRFARAAGRFEATAHVAAAVRGADREQERAARAVPPASIAGGGCRYVRAALALREDPAQAAAARGRWCAAARAGALVGHLA